MKSSRLVPAPACPVRMPVDTEALRREFRFMLYGGRDPRDKLWRQWSSDGRHCRRRGTRDSPLAFAYVYLNQGMKPMRTASGPVISFSEFHLALCEEAKYWMKPDGRRMGLIGPRGIGKTFWAYEALPIWAVAHGHRDFFMGYVHTNDQAKNPLTNIRDHLTGNELLLYDFPELAVPKGGRNNSQLVETTGGKAFATSGIDKVTLGARHKYDRPDLTTIDDGEPNEGSYNKIGSKGSKEDRLKTIRDIVLPMNPDAVVLLSGTVVMPDSIAHNLVKAALGEPTEDWVAEERFQAMYFNAILDEGTPNERSIWPEKWSLEWLRRERNDNPVYYSKHYANQPTTHGGQYWQEEDFRYNPHFPRDHYVMYVDPAVVPLPGRDKTALILVGADAGRHRAVVEGAFQGHMTATELGNKIAQFKLSRPDIARLDVYIEKTQGGHLWSETIERYVGLPPGVKLHLDDPPQGSSKLARIQTAHGHYQANRVWHVRPFTELQALLTAFPKIRNDDLPDSLAGALRKALARHSP